MRIFVRSTAVQARYLTLHELERRGWSTPAVQAHLGSCDQMIGDDQVWLRRRVIEVLQGYARRTPRDQMHGLGILLRSAYPNWDVEWLLFDAVKNHNSFYQTRLYGVGAVDPGAILGPENAVWPSIPLDSSTKDMVVNYIRHAFCSYEREAGGYSGSQRVRMRNEYLEAIGEAFPWLADTAVRRRKNPSLGGLWPS